MEMLGMYPTWYDPTLGSGWVLAVIAVIHVLASHTSVGAALVFAWLATAAYKRQRPELLEYVRRYGVVLLALFTWKGPEKAGHFMPVVAMVMALALGALREALRYAALHGGFGYDFMNYKIVMAWYSTILFFGTVLIVGGIPLAFMISLSWEAGRAKGVYTAGPVIAKLGMASVAVAGLWVVHYFVMGAVVLGP